MKRILDFTVSLVLLLILLPIIIGTSFFISIKMGNPVLFKQLRPGLKAKPFYLYKFRTMSQERDEQGNFLPDGERLTDLGQTLRRFSIDELPQFLNVLKGNMSLVGPRPLLMSYLPLYTEEQARRHEVKPGITGWAQINGRNALTWEEKFVLDVWYVDNHSFMLDLKILFATAFKVIRSEGISNAGWATMPEFKGSKKESKEICK